MNSQRERSADDEAQQRACGRVAAIENRARRERARSRSNQCPDCVERVIYDGDFVARDFNDGGNGERAQRQRRGEPREMARGVKAESAEMKRHGQREKRQKGA